ncbi:thioredoxin [Patescibacteria group bacterium]|nr:thioredoxin [Patescibacteria group bacterium]
MPHIEGNSNNFKTEVLEAEGKVLVDFWAPWCGPCQMLGPVIEEIADENKQFKIVKVNIDENASLAQDYAISSIPAVLIFQNGKVVDTLIGLRAKQDYLNALK